MGSPIIMLSSNRYILMPLVQEEKKMQFLHVWFMMWKCYILKTINVKLSNILRAKMLTYPLFTFCYCCCATPAMDVHRLQTLTFLFLSLFIQLLFKDKLLRWAFLVPLLIIQGCLRSSSLGIYSAASSQLVSATRINYKPMTLKVTSLV